MSSKPEFRITVRVSSRREVEARLLAEVQRTRQEFAKAKGTEKLPAKARYIAALERFTAVAVKEKVIPDVDLGDALG